MLMLIGGPEAVEKKEGGSPFGGSKKKATMIGGPDEEEAEEEEGASMDADAQKDEALRLMGVPQEKREQFSKALESFIKACSY
jgi:hypothetical protein